jgi:hypothetical protein
VFLSAVGMSVASILRTLLIDLRNALGGRDARSTVRKTRAPLYFGVGERIHVIRWSMNLTMKNINIRTANH